METFIEFVKFMEQIQVSELVNMTALKRLVKIYNETREIINFIKEIVYNYAPKVDKLIETQKEKISKEMFDKVKDPNRPLFSEETAKKIMNHLDGEIKQEIEE